MNRAEKRATILAELTADDSRSDRAIASLVGVSPTTVGEIRKSLAATVQIQTGQHVQSVQIETGHRPDWLSDPAMRTPAAVAKWLVETFPHAVDRIIASLQRHAAAQPSSELTISWAAGKAARDLARAWSTAKLDELGRHLKDGGPTRMTETERHALWGPAPRVRPCSPCEISPAATSCTPEKVWNRSSASQTEGTCPAPTQSGQLLQAAATGSAPSWCHQAQHASVEVSPTSTCERGPSQVYNRALARDRVHG